MPAPIGAAQPHLVRPRMIGGRGLTPSGGIAAGSAPSEPTADQDQEGDWLGGLAVAVTGLVTIRTGSRRHRHPGDGLCQKALV